MRRFIFVLILIMLSVGALADGLVVSTVADSTGVVPGQVVNITSTLVNSYTASPPIEIVATASYNVGLRPAETVTSKVTLSLTKPVTIPSLSLPLGSNFALVDGSVKLDNAVVTPTVANNVLTIPLAKILTEGQAATVTFRLLAQ